MAVSGRLATILDMVKSLFNERAVSGSGSSFLQTTEMVVWANACTRELAQKGIWVTTGNLSLVVDTAEYNLLTTLPTLVDCYDLVWIETAKSLFRYTNRREYILAKADHINWPISADTPYAYWKEGENVTVVPTPETSQSNVISVFYSYQPTDFDEVSSFTPSIPQAFDDVYTYWILKQAFLKAKYSKNASERIMYYDTMFNKLLRKLLAQRNPADIYEVPYR